MKTFAAVAVLAAASTVNAWDAEFIRGAQTGMFLTSEDQFEDYSCPAPGMSPQIQSYLDMAQPMLMMVKNMNHGEPMPALDLALEFAQVAGKAYSIFSNDYDGGEFCKGLLFAKEASAVVFKVGNMIMHPPKPEEKSAGKIADKKKLALENMFQ